mmetsp:Transcript_15226/g.34093  ORF Transcript_15226/g.34093 Transcript_15226/m.34093 type:complete len:316 (-) Transcript_15226:1096-2043(-)
MSFDDAIVDLRMRVQKYEEQYETVDDDEVSYIKVFNLSSKVLANNIYGRLSKTIIPALMSWHIGTRPIWICRAGETVGSKTRGDSLGTSGFEFRQKLGEYVENQAVKFMKDFRQFESTDSLVSLAESVCGEYPGDLKVTRNSVATFGRKSVMLVRHDGTRKRAGAFKVPIKVMTSTMKRAIQTVSLQNLVDLDIEETSNLNPLDKGDYSGMDLKDIKEKDPKWYKLLEKDPFSTRFHGGESYMDLIKRLESSVIDMEQQVVPVLVCSHISVIQCLLAYFRNIPVKECTSIEVPLHTLIELVPTAGGEWYESHEPS